MLFSYQYVNHSMEKMQGYIDFIFNKVWCEAPGKEYDIELFNENEELKELLTELNHLEGAYFFLAGIERIFHLFSRLNRKTINKLTKWYYFNNQIEKLCSKEECYNPVNYEQFSCNEELKKALKAFFQHLYDNNFLSLKAVKDKIGSIDDHYNQFMHINTKGICPFCGLYPIDSEYASTREAYDHFLPKSIYPFCSINFRNLAPMCNKCNSGHKNQRDPLYDNEGNRRKAFFAYDSVSSEIEIEISIKSNNYNNLKPDDIEITFRPDDISEELNTWKDLFDIEERYKEVCCKPSDGIYWIQQVLDESKNYEEVPLDILKYKSREADRYPFNEKNFLKRAFLEACENKGLFSE